MTRLREAGASAGRHEALQRSIVVRRDARPRRDSRGTIAVLRRPMTRDVGQLDDVGDAARRRAPMRSTAARASRCVARSLQTGDALEQRGQRRRRSARSARRAHRRGRGFDIALAQMEQMAARLDLAGAAQVGRIDAQPSNGSAPDTTTWSARIAPNSNGNASSDRPNSAPRAAAASRGPASCQAATRAAHARRSSAVRRVDDRQRGRRRARRSRPAVRVRDERSQAIAEDARADRDRACGRRQDRHDLIVQSRLTLCRM